MSEPKSPVVEWSMTAINWYWRIDKLLAYIEPVAMLLLKLWIASIFFKSGLSKIQSIDTTIVLFAYEYSVPVLSPTLAAYLAIVAELVLPVLLVIGISGRLTAAALFIFNFVAVISYPDISEAGVQDHMIWGMILLLLMGYGAGKLSLDKFICRKLGKNG